MDVRATLRLTLPAAVLALSVGCNTDRVPGAGGVATVSDSGGIRIVSNGSSGALRVGSVEPVWKHGHEAGDYAFHFVSHGALRSDGSAVVGDMGNHEVVALDAAGEAYTVLARTGQGPSEVVRPRAVIGAGGRRVWVEDGGNGKLLLFDGDSLGSTVSTKAVPEVARGLMPQGVDEEGRLLMTTASFRPVFEEPWFLGKMVRFDPTTGIVDTVGSYPLARRRTEGPPNPFATYGVVASTGGGFINARTDQPEVVWRAADGAVFQISRWEAQFHLPTDSLWTRFEASLRADLRRVNPQLSGHELDKFVNQEVARYEVDPSTPLPLFGRIHGTPDGGVWLASFSPGNTWPTQYRVMSASGEWLGIVEFPKPFWILDIRGDRALGVEKDEMEVEAVALYRYRFDS